MPTPWLSTTNAGTAPTAYTVGTSPGTTVSQFLTTTDLRPLLNPAVWTTLYTSTTAATTTISTFGNAIADWGQTLNYQVRYQIPQLFTTNLRLYDGTALAGYDPKEAAKEKRRKARAEGRARRLLKEHLTVLEHDQLEQDGYFEVVSDSGRIYRIYRGYSRNIVEIDPKTGLAVARLCAHGGYGTGMPTEDHMLAQKLFLQAAEDDFRRVANISKIGSVEAEQLRRIA